MIFLKITDKNNNLKFETKGQRIEAEYQGEFCAGDEIVIRIDGANTVAVRFDESLQESFLYVPNRSFTFKIPSERELQMGYAPTAFRGDKHVICAREVEDEEFYATRNIALNAHDLRSKTGGYPHASANFVTGLCVIYSAL